MKDICLRKLFEQEGFFLNDSFRTRLVLLGCNVCKKMESKEKINQYEELLIVPVLISQKKNETDFMRMIGCAILEKLAEKFGNANEKEIENFLNDLSLVEKNQKQYSYQWLDNISEGTYCKIIARLYWMECYDLIFMIAIQYIVNRTNITGSSVRTNWYYKNVEEPFFQIGIALDEGTVQTLTMEIMSSAKAKEQSKTRDKTKSSRTLLSDAYFFEMKFVDKIINTFKLDREKFLGSLFSNNCLDFLIEETRKVDYCDLYKLLMLSDQCKWKEVNNILKKYMR